MKHKSSNENLQILQCVEIRFENLGLLSKKVKIAQVKGKFKYYVWLEDSEEDDSDDIEPIPLSEINQHNPNVCKSKQTAFEIFNFYVDTLSSTNGDTLAYFESKTSVPSA